MSKRLLIAVLILGLCLAFTGTVMSYTGFERGDNQWQPRVVEGADRIGIALSDQLTPPVNFRADRTFRSYDPDLPESTGDKHICGILDYTSNDANWYGTDWYGDDGSLMACRFDVLEPEHHTVELRGAKIRIYDWSNNSGGCDIVITVYENAGGVPGAVLYTQTYLATYIQANIPTGNANYVFPFTTPVIITGNSYIISYGTGGAGPADDYITFGISTNAEGADNGRCLYYWPGGPQWMSLADAFGQPMNCRLGADVCHIYSNCYTLENGLDYIVPVPQPGLIDGQWDGFCQSFTAANDTLMEIMVPFYIHPETQVYAGTNELNYCLVQVWSDVAGSPNTAVPPLFEYTIPAGEDNMFPTNGEVRGNWREEHWIDVSASNIIVKGAVHISATILGPGGAMADPADGQIWVLVEDFGVGGSVAYNGTDDFESTVTNASWIDFWWNEAGFNMAAYFCPSEFQLCDYQLLYDDPGIEWGYGMDGAVDAGNSLAMAQKVVTPGEDNLVESFRFLIDLIGGDMGVRVLFWDNLGTDFEGNSGAPGNLLAYYDIATPAFYPGWNDITIPEGILLMGGDFYIGYEPILSDPPVVGEGIVCLTSLAGGDYGNVPINGGIYYYHAGAGPAWLSMYGYWGYEENLFMEVEFCAIEIPRMPCYPDDDAGWATLQGNYARTGGSDLAVGDVWCDFNRNWDYIDAGGVLSYCGPVTKGNMVVQSFEDHYVVLDIHTGLPIYTWDASFADGDVISTQIRSTPTIATLNFGDETTPDWKDICFIAGGTNNSIAAVDLATGLAVWIRTITEIPNPFEFFGRVRFSSFMVLEVAGHDVLFFGTDDGKVAAVEAINGDLFIESNYPGEGWPDANHPAIMTGSAWLSGATDGTNLYYATSSTATEGDIYSFSAADGSLNWNLQGAGGLQAANIFTHENGYLYPEGFHGGVSLDVSKNTLFANSYANEGGASDGPTDGVFYIIDASSGQLKTGAVASNRCNYASPIVDAAKVYVPSFTQWTGGTVGGALLAFNRSTAAIVWDYPGPSDAVYYTNGFRSCEGEGMEDLLFVFNSDGFFECVNAVTGQMVFTRRVDHEEGYNAGMGSAITMAPNVDPELDDVLHILTSDNSGGVYDLTEGVAPRPRMEILTYTPIGSVDFGTNAAFPFTYGDFITNTGCADLTVTALNVDDEPFLSNIPAFKSSVVREDVMVNALSIADRLTNDALIKSYAPNTVVANETVLSDRDISKTREVNSFSAGWPAWLASVEVPYVGQIIPAGETIPLDITVNQLEISRGPQTAYMQIETNDTDFFLNTEYTGLLPEVAFTIIGGCLIDFTPLAYGLTLQNEQLVTNTGRIGDGDWGDAYGYNGLYVGGEGAAYYQGSYIYGNRKYALSMHVCDWWSNTDGEFVTMQPDPNWCDATCKPYIESTPQVVGSGISRDGGLNYDPISARFVCKSFLDSGMNFDTDPDPEVIACDWEWGPHTQYLAPFDDTLTMGLYATSTVFGVEGVAELDNVTLEIIHFNERNGNTVDNWFFGEFWDCDLGADEPGIDRNVSALWAFPTPAADWAMGAIKIPFGYGNNDNGDWDFTSALNVKGLGGDYALFGSTNYYDSAYIYLSGGTGELPRQAMHASDEEIHFTYAGHNFEENGTYSIAIAHFAAFDLEDAHTSDGFQGLCHFVNKWAGFGRGDVNNDNVINILDILYLAQRVNFGGPGPVPFEHLGDVDADGDVDGMDVTYLLTWYTSPWTAPGPRGDWVLEM